MTRDWIPPTQDLPHSPPPPPEPTLPAIAEALVIRPGDTLIVRVPLSTSAQQAGHLKERLAELLPGVRARVIAAEQLAVYRPTTDNQQT